MTYPATTFTTTKEVLIDLQNVILDWLEADERIDADELTGNSYSMYTHSLEIEGQTIQNVPFKINISVTR